MNMDDFLREIHAFLGKTGMRPSMLGHRAVNDGKFVSRLERGGQVTLRTMARVRRFMVRHEVALEMGGAGRIKQSDTTPKAA